MAQDPINEVRLQGRVSALEEPRALPSGDCVVSLRVVVPRPARPTSGSQARVDTIDVSCWSASTRRAAGRLATGEDVLVVGSLRRRFFRTPAGAASRYEVEAVTIRKVTSSVTS